MAAAVKGSPLTLRLCDSCIEVVKVCRCAVTLHDCFKHSGVVAQIAQLLDQLCLNWLHKIVACVKNCPIYVAAARPGGRCQMQSSTLC